MKTQRLGLDDIIGDLPLNDAETHLVEMCAVGEVAIFGDKPTAGTEQNTIRATLIRHILLGGCDDAPVHAKGVQIQGAWITGVLDLEACDSPLDLYLAGCTICEQSVLMDARLGSVMLPGCKVPGLNAHRLQVARAVLLNHGFQAKGTVDLSSARIGGVLACDNGTFDGAGGVALRCDAMTVGTDVFLSDGFTATGQVNLMRAQITGQLDCVGGTFDGAGGVALMCNAMTVGASVFLRDGFTATGQVDLGGAQITGQLACTGGTFDGAGDVALMCEALTVGADVFLHGGFAAAGQVNLRRAQITGHLLCSGATIKGLLNCEGMSVDGGMYWHDVTKPPLAIDLTDAHVGALRDDDASWQGCLSVLNGFRYDRIISEVSVTERLAWLGRKYETPIKAAVQMDGAPLPWLSKAGDQKFDPQPYSQLATVLRAQGNASGAARVLVAREKRLGRAGYLRAQAALGPEGAPAVRSSLLAMIKRPFDGLFGLVFGYGHQPARALVAVFLIWAGCFWLYGAAYNAGQMAPNSDVVLTSAEWQAAAVGYTDENRPKAPEGWDQAEWIVRSSHACATVKQADCEMPLILWQTSNTATDYETFNRGLYALDLFVPLDALGQENAWAPSKDRGALGWWAYYLRWAVQMSGWVITAVAAAALTGVIGRKQ